MAGPIEGEVGAFVVLQGRVCSGWNGVWWWRRAEEEEVYGRDEVQGVGAERREESRREFQLPSKSKPHLCAFNW